MINTKEQIVTNSTKMHLKEKIYKLNTVFQATGLIFTFINTNLLLKLGHANRNLSNKIER